MKGLLMNTLRTQRLAGLFAALLLTIFLTLPAQAAPSATTATNSSYPNANRCLPHKQIETWNSRRSIEARGFQFDLIGPEASALFQHDLALNLARNPANSFTTASRMTEIASEKPIAERVKCWQATPDKNVVIEFRVRFNQSATPAGMTENLELWNAPLPFFDGTNPPTESPLPLTSIGVARTSAFGQPQYVATVVQDLDLATFNGLLRMNAMPPWLDAGRWHEVRLTLSQKEARIEVAQAGHREEVLKVELPHPAEPLGFEFSIDNEAFPGVFVPVTERDGIEVDYLSMHMVQTR